MDKKRTGNDTRERLLDKGEILFAEKGYHAVSIREITKAAGCNVAGVNYYFGGKKQLYIEVFRSRWMRRAKLIREHLTRSLSTGDSLSPQKIIQALALAFFEGPLTNEERIIHFQLMSRELGRPTEALELVADNVMKPFFKELAGRLKPILSENTDSEKTMLNLLSIFSIVLYFNFAKGAVSRITGREYDSEFKTQLVEHIIEFALNGLGGCKEEL